MSTMEMTYTVPDVHCQHCRHAITTEVERIGGIESVEVDLERKHVHVTGVDLDDAAVRSAIDEAGFEIA